MIDQKLREPIPAWADKEWRADKARLAEAMAEIERLRGLLRDILDDLTIGAHPHIHIDRIRAALGTASDQPSAAMSAKEHCRLFCAWKGGEPCLADDCPRRHADQPPACANCGGSGIIRWQAYDGTEEGHEEQDPCPVCAADESPEVAK